MGSQAGGTSHVTIKSQQQNVMVSNVALRDTGRAVSQKRKTKQQQTTIATNTTTTLRRSEVYWRDPLSKMLKVLQLALRELGNFSFLLE